MVWKDLMTTLQRDGYRVTEPQIRWAISSGKISRPPLDASLRFVFGEQHLDQLRQLFKTKVKEASPC